MKKIFLSLIILITSLVLITLSFLTIFGFETNKFNNLLEDKVILSEPNVKINLNKIKFKIDIKNLSLFITTKNPELIYYDNKIKIDKINAYIDAKSLLFGNPKIKKVFLASKNTDIKEIQDIIKLVKPSTFKKFILNDIEKGIINLSLDLFFDDNSLSNFEINGYAKNFSANIQKVQLKNASFVFSSIKKLSEINELRGLINGIQINSGDIKIDSSKFLKVKGNLIADANLTKKEISRIYKNNWIADYEIFNINGKVNNEFEINFDNTLKVINYNLNLSGEINKSEFKFYSPKKIFFIKNKINQINFEKVKFDTTLHKDKKKAFNISGLYNLNNKSSQKFELTNIFSGSDHNLKIKANYLGNILIPYLNFETKNKVVNFFTHIDIKKKSFNLKDFSMRQDKNEISIKNLIVKNNTLSSFENVYIKTFKNNELNNDFKIRYSKKIEIKGSKYDASNLTKFLTKKRNTVFLNNLNKEISVNIDQINTDVSDQMNNFSLIGFIANGKFNKIVSKGEFSKDKFLEISLRQDEISKMKILEVYSDLPKPLLSNYKFFDGLSGGKLLLTSYYNSDKSSSNLIIENFKVKNAPGLVKLLSLADFGGMVDALSGDGLSFEKLEMKMEKNSKVLNLAELYAIGPSISILMEGYVESETGLVSLRGTMIPAKMLNKFLSKLPIVGDILIPKEIGEGLFGISFKMKGPPGKVKTSVNPIKTLTPRFIQKALNKSK